jgi:hypothetical protein
VGHRGPLAWPFGPLTFAAAATSAETPIAAKSSRPASFLCTPRTEQRSARFSQEIFEHGHGRLGLRVTAKMNEATVKPNFAHSGVFWQNFLRSPNLATRGGGDLKRGR